VGAYLDARGATQTYLYLTNATGSTSYADIMHDGQIKWTPSKSANTWRLGCELAAHQTLYVENLNAVYRASLDLPYGNLTLGNGLLTVDGQGVTVGGASPGYRYTTPQTRLVKVPVWGWHLITAGAAVIFGGSGGSPPDVRSSTTADLTFSVPLNPYLGLDPSNTGADLTLDAVRLWYLCSSATGSITYTLKSSDDGGASPSSVTTHYTWTNTSTAGWSQAVTPAATGLGLSLDIDKIYWVEITLSPTALGVATDYRAHAVNLTILQGTAI
jgi:hypothetical protein